MSYSESKIRLTLVSPNLDEIQYVSDKIKSNLDKKGGEYNGPFALPKTDPDYLTAFLKHIQDPTSNETLDRDYFKNWLFEIADSEGKRDILIKAVEDELSLHIRMYEIYGSRMIESALKFELPDPVSAVANLEKETRKKGMGKAPYGWDPNVEHDFDYS